MSDDVLAALLLTNRISGADVDPLTASQFWRCVGAVPEGLGTLLGLSAGEIGERTGLDRATAERVAALLDAATGFALERERLENNGIAMVAALDERYPARLRERLRDAAPPILYVAGPVEWLSTGWLGIVGSRNVSGAGGEVARRSAEVAVRLGRALVSGAARGVDQVAMAAALENDGPVVGVTTEGLARVGRRADLRRAVTEGRLCLATPYAPDAGFSAGAAMGRNKIIYAIADATLVVASDHGSGGTWRGATEALKRGYGRVLVWRGDGEGPGNAPLEALGATPVTSLDTLADVLASVEDPDPADPVHPSVTPAEQLPLTFPEPSDAVG